MQWVFLLILVVRILNALSIKTFFQPDEYYQSLEPAYNYVFKTTQLTWEWQYQLRSCLQPLMFVPVYKFCQVLELNDVWIRFLPKVLQAIWSSIGEYHIFLLALKTTCNYKMALVTLLLSLTSPFNWFFITRTFSNNLEMILTVVALNYFPIEKTQTMASSAAAGAGANQGLGQGQGQGQGQLKTSYWYQYSSSIALATISCIVRPTNAFIWLMLGISFLYDTTHRIKAIIVTAVTVICVMLLNFAIDYAFYGQLTFPIYNFIKFNVINSSSKFYGMNSMSFYFTQAIPVIMTTYLPLLALGQIAIWKSRNLVLKKLSIVAFCNIVAFSFVSHKEFRFIYPLMPIFMISSSFGYVYLSRRYRKKRRLVFSMVLVINVLISYYMTQIHEKGVIEVIDHLKTGIRVKPGESIGMFMPCHSTPWQSYANLDPSIEMWSLTCEPPLNGQDLETYMDESDHFYADPVAFMENPLKMTHIWPDYLVIFDALPIDAKNYLKDMKNYKEIYRTFNTVSHWDSRRNGDVIVMARSKFLN